MINVKVNKETDKISLLLVKKKNISLSTDLNFS